MTTDTPKRYSQAEILEIIDHSDNFYYDNDEVWQNAIKQLLADLHEAKKTLSWYANNGNYNRYGAPTNCRVTGDDGFKLDWGKRAFKTLEEIA